MAKQVTLGATDRTVLVFIPDPASTDGSGKTGLAHTDMTVSGTRVETDNDVVCTDYTSSLNALTNLTDAHNDWGWKEVSSTLAPGLYRLDIADAIFASGAWYAVVYVQITSSAAAASPIEFELIAYNPLDSVRLGLTALPNAAADAAGGLIISDAGGLDADAQRSDVAAILVDTGTTLDGRIPAALVGGRIDANVGAISSDATAADNAEAFFDGTGYAGTNNVIPLVTTVSGNVGGNVTGSVGSVASGGISAASFAAGAIDAAAIAANAIGASELAADAVAEIQSGLSTLDAAGVRTAVGLASANLDTQFGLLATAAALATVDTEVAAILEDTGTTIPAQIAALNNLSSAQVNAEVLDVLNVDTFAEPAQGTPGATISLAAKIGYLYKFLRNRKTQTATTKSIYNDDATTVDHKCTVADDGTTYSETEMTTGP